MPCHDCDYNPFTNRKDKYQSLDYEPDYCKLMTHDLSPLLNHDEVKSDFINFIPLNRELIKETIKKEIIYGHIARIERESKSLIKKLYSGHDEQVKNKLKCLSMDHDFLKEYLSNMEENNGEIISQWTREDRIERGCSY